MKLSLDKHGRLKVSEADVVKAITQLAAFRGWLAIQTPAEAFLPSGRRVVNSGFGDLVLVHPSRPAMFVEAKRPNALTTPARRKKQEAWQQDMQQRGYIAYRCPDGCADPVNHFREWYRSCFGEVI